MSAARMGVADRWARRLFLLAVVGAAFGSGAYLARAGVFPWPLMRDGVATALSIGRAWTDEFPLLAEEMVVLDMSPDGVEAHRVRASGQERGGERAG